MKFLESILNIGICATALYIIYKVYRKTDRHKKYIVCLSLATTFQFLSETFRFHRDFILKNETAPLDAVNIFFVLSMLSIIAAIYYLIQQNLERWNSLRFIVNVFFFGSVFCYIEWEFFLKHLSNFRVENGFGLPEVTVGVIYFFFNLFALLVLLAFYNLQREYISKKINQLEGLGYVTWLLTCITPIYLQMSKISINQIVLNFLWTSSMFLLVFCAYKKRGKKSSEDLTSYSERTLDQLNFLTSLIFLVIIFSKNKIVFVIFASLYIFRFFLYKHISVYEKNEILAEKYREDNILLEEKNKTLYSVANLDALTQIFNRRKLLEELDELTRKDGKFSLLFLDLDGFKSVNDTYGHDIGDAVLIETTSRIKKIIRNEDFFARHGGDEFIIIFKNIESLEVIEKKNHDILKTLEKNFYIESHKINISASIGIALYPEDAITTKELMICGDKALYISKTSGKNRFSFHNAIKV